MTRWPTCLGATGWEGLLRLTLAAGIAQGVIRERDLREVLVDITVMKKTGTYPAESKPDVKSQLRLNRAAGVPSRQTPAQQSGWQCRLRIPDQRDRSFRRNVTGYSGAT